MHPQVIPGWPLLHSYGLMLVVAFYSAYFLSRRTAKKEGVHPDRMIDILVIGALLGIIGSRAFFVIQYGVSSFWQVFAIWRGGLVFYGGLVLATVGLIVYIRKKKLPLWRLADAAAPAIM
ncbi:MAG: prolipoprotein diacylglyceryl transferase, partial [Planctomycetota bacterium]